MLPSIVFWQNELSIHQESLFQEFGKSTENPICVVTNKGVPARRIAQGWNQVNYGRVEIKITRSLVERQKLINQYGPNSIHIISGLGREKTLRKTQRMLITNEHKIGFYLEPWNTTGILRSYMRVLFYRWQLRGSRKLRPFFLTTGASGLKQLLSLGIEESQIFTFGYFLKNTENLVQNEPHTSFKSNKSVNILFVGSLSTGKQPLNLVREFLERDACDLKLTVIGDGQDRPEIVTLAQKYPKRLKYLGSLSNEQTRLQMRSSDFLILPSKYDGWGAVVSESLSEGTPVLASSACGASQVVVSDAQGYVFAPGALGIQGALDFAVRVGPQTVTNRLKLQKWAKANLSGAAGAAYLSRILSYHFDQNRCRPVAPWAGSDPTSGEAS